MTERASYCISEENRVQHWFDHFEKRGRHPALVTEPEKTAVNPVWVIEFDASPIVLEADEHSPVGTQRHWARPEYHAVYGHWFNQHPPVMSRCCVQTGGQGRGSSPGQCQRKAKHDVDHTGNPTRCTQHSRDYLYRKQLKAQAERNNLQRLQSHRSQVRQGKEMALDLLHQIADGHNDPRGAAHELLVAYGFRSEPEGDTND